MHCGCRSRSTTRDDQTGNLVCSECGTLLQFDNYDAQIGGVYGPTGTNIYIGQSGSGSSYTYKEIKLLKSKSFIHEFTESLDLSHLENEVTLMIDDVTQGEFGLGDWFRVLIGACVYLSMRKADKFLSMEEVSEVVPCDVYELGRMISRVSSYLNLDLPEFSIAVLVEREFSRLPSLNQVGDVVKNRMKKQGVFLVNCTVKWFLSTGRRPLPLVAAVIVLVAQLNEVKNVKIENVANEVRAKAGTSRLRYKELLEALVDVAQVLPWGKDVTVKNVVRHAPFIIRYMEMKSMEKCGIRKKRVESNGEECSEFHDECDGGFRNFDCIDWWSGKSELSEKLLLKQILEKEVGMDAMPPSFVGGLAVVERRRAKINAAKAHIRRTMYPSDANATADDDDDDDGSQVSEHVSHGKKRKRKGPSGIDWEDVIIETLLLHSVKEEEIEKGYYKTLMDLHVFNSGVI